MSRQFLTRLIIETTSPLAVHSGARETGFDSQVALDWNNLPYIPATSITGAWRNAVKSLFDDEYEINKWFGSANGSGCASRICISDALLLNSQGKLPEHALYSDEEINSDEMYSVNLAKHRDRCRITHRGVAAKQAKFDVSVLPSGVRFVMTISTTIENDDEKNIFKSFINLFGDNSLRLGSNKTVGLGTFEIISKNELDIDLKNGGDYFAEQIKNFKKLPYDKSSISPCVGESLFTKIASIPMKSEDSWSIGMGSKSINSKYSSVNASFCYSEEYVKWNINNTLAKVNQRRVVICGSMIKGILAHRIKYHYNRLSEIYADEGLEENDNLELNLADDLKPLFGYIDGKSARQGSLIVAEAIVGDVENLRTFIRTHNKVDYFTSGMIPGALFSEERIYKPGMVFDIYIRNSIISELNSNVKKAIILAIDDIKDGFLPIAAGSGREAGLMCLDQTKNCEINTKILE